MYFASLCVQPLSVVSLLQPDGAARTRERRPTPTAHADAPAHAVRQEMQKPSAFKSEWATVKDGSLVVGSTGAESIRRQRRRTCRTRRARGARVRAACLPACLPACLAASSSARTSPVCAIRRQGVCARQPHRSLAPAPSQDVETRRLHRRRRLVCELRRAACGGELLGSARVSGAQPSDSCCSCLRARSRAVRTKPSLGFGVRLRRSTRMCTQNG